MKLKKIKIIIPLALVLLIAAGCTPSDKDLAVGFLMMWAEQQGIVNEDGTPTLSAIGRATFGSSTGDPQTDAAIDAGLVAKNINDSDKELDKADQSLAKDPPDRAKALDHLDEAVKIRPNDWYIRNKRATINAEAGSVSKSQEDATKAKKSCDAYERHDKVVCKIRVNEHRIELIDDSIARQIRLGGKVKCATYKLQAETYDEMGDVSAGVVETSGQIEGYFQAEMRARELSRQPGVTCAP